MDPWTTNQQIEELLPSDDYTVIAGPMGGLTDEELAQLLGVEVEEILSVL
jgi:transcription initiation factor IIE alpha subunit